VLHYAGVRPARARRVISLDGFGVRAEESSAAPDKMAKWLDALASARDFAPYASLDAVADRLQKSNPRLPRDKAVFLAAHWAEALPDGTIRLASDPRHRLPFPTVYRIEETYAVWRNHRGADAVGRGRGLEHPALARRPSRREGATDSFAVVRRRFAHIPNGKMVTIPEPVTCCITTSPPPWPRRWSVSR
jgi:hypothetical protein